MTSLCGSLIEYLDSNENSKGDVLAGQAWGLIRESQKPTQAGMDRSLVGEKMDQERALGQG